MTVSIIIPVYNVEPYISGCLRSVMAQNGDIECILVDDCGHDKSMEIAEKMIIGYKGHVRFRILHHEHNKGLSEARNTGMRAAKGEYLYFLDSDDTITSDCIASMFAMVKKYPEAECVFAGAEASKYTEWMDYTKKDFPEYSDDRNWLQEGMLLRFKFSMTAWNKLISTEFIKANNLYFEEGFIYEDELWNLAASQHIQKAAFLGKNTYNHLIRENSIMTSTIDNDRLYLDNRLRLWNKMLAYVDGYRRGIQPYYIVKFAQEGFSHINRFDDYLKMMHILIKAIFKSNMKYSRTIIHIMLGWNKSLTKRAIRCCLRPSL